MRAAAQAHIDQINQAVDLLRRFLDWDVAKARLEELNAKIEDASLWNDPGAGREVMRERGRLDAAIATVRKISQERDDATEMMELAEAETMKA